MARPPVHSVETKLRIVLSVLRGELSAAEAARRHGISETSIGKWKEQFLEAGKTGLAAANGPRRGPSGREAQLAAQVDELTRALGEAHVELRLLRRDGAGLPPTSSWR
jgi:transposase